MFPRVSLIDGLVDVRVAAPRGCFVCRGGGLGNHHRWWSYEVGLRLFMAWVTVLCHLGGGFVGPADASQWGWLNF
jgi:hypothetical protein